jgi:hypothetical protein
MRRQDLEHIVRAASAITGEQDVLVVGSSAVLGSWDESRLPPEATRSIEADIAFFDDPDDLKADLVDGAIGELSLFHTTFGYHAQGVSLGTARSPEGWRERLVVLDTPSTRPGRGLCLEAHDCAISKLVASRPKDREFAAALIEGGLLDVVRLAERLEALSGVEHTVIDRIRAWLRDRSGGR